MVSQKNIKYEEINLLTIRQYKREENKAKKNAILNDILTFNAAMIHDCTVKTKYIWGKKCRQLGVGIEEVENTARMGLVKAVEMFDSEKKTSSLSYYFYTFMENEIKLEYRDNRHYTNIAKKIKALQDQYESYGLTPPSETEMSQMLDIPLNSIKLAINFTRVEESASVENLKVTVKDKNIDIVEQTETNIFMHDLHKQIALLDKFEEQLVLIYKFGIKLMTTNDDKHDKHIILLNKKIKEFEKTLNEEQKKALENIFLDGSKNASELSFRDIAKVLNKSTFVVTELYNDAVMKLKRNSIVAKYSKKGVAQTDATSILSEAFTLSFAEEIDERLITSDDDILNDIFDDEIFI